MKLAHLHASKETEPIWHIQLAVIVAICLQVTLNEQLAVGPKYVTATLELLLLVALALISPRSHSVVSRVRRGIAILLIALISATNIASLILVLHELLSANTVTGSQLILSAFSIYITNIIIFGVWYWELDSGGHTGRNTVQVAADFQFPQMSNSSETTRSTWQPTFFDYLYVSVTNATAFSPTDAMPLTHRAKLLMAVQSLVSLVTIALVAARAVNILL